MALNFPNNPNVNDTYQFNNLVFVYDGVKWKVDGQLSYIQDSLQFIRSGTQLERPTVSAPTLYYNTDLEGLEFYYPEIDTWEVVSTFAKQVDPTQDSGQTAYTSPGTYTWVCPANVFQVHVVCVGGGGGGTGNTAGGAGGGGGGLGWINNYPVIPGNTYTVVVGSGGVRNGSSGGNSFFVSLGTVAGFGGATGGSGGDCFPPTQGGRGGLGGSPAGVCGGGGGAGGYSGNGGNGGSGGSVGQSGSGGAGGGGGGSAALSNRFGGGGGGVGILGIGSPGSGGVIEGGGGGGSGGSSGSSLVTGGSYGGGGGGGDTSAYNPGDGASGAVRIIWGPNRAFPSTNTGDV